MAGQPHHALRSCARTRSRKRFGAVVVADEVDLALAEGEALGIIGPNGAGKTTLFDIIDRHGRAGRRPRRLRRRATSRGLPPQRRCRAGHRALVPDPAAVRRHDACSRTWWSPRPSAAASASATAMRAASRCSSDCGLADKANRPAGTLTLLDRKRLELARALATRAALLLLDEIAGGLTEHECAALVELIQAVTRARHDDRLDRARRACAARGRRPAGRAACRRASSPKATRTTVIRSPAVREIYMGIAADA